MQWLACVQQCIHSPHGAAHHLGEILLGGLAVGAPPVVASEDLWCGHNGGGGGFGE